MTASGGATEVAAAVVLHAGRVLVQTRPEGRRWAGYWEFPGGKREAGESAHACAERECREELGLAVRALESLHTERWSYPGVTVEVTFVLCEPVDPAGAEDRPAALEGQQVRWADGDDLVTLPFLPANARVLRQLAARLADPD